MIFYILSTCLLKNGIDIEEKLDVDRFKSEL